MDAMLRKEDWKLAAEELKRENYYIIVFTQWLIMY